MKKIFLVFLLNCFFVASVYAETKEFSNMEEAQAEAEAIAAQRNKELLKAQPRQEKLPQTEDEMLEFMRERLDKLDITVLPKGERFDKISSFSRIDDDQPVKEKSTWEKIYDGAMERISGKKTEEQEPYSAVQYYQSADVVKEKDATEQVPSINIQMPDGIMIEAPAYEHIPYYSTKIEVVPNQMLKVTEQIVVVANGNKIKNPLVRFINKKKFVGTGKFQIVLDEVQVNGTLIPYEVKEDYDYYTIRPVKNATLPEGVYIFEFRYFVENYLADSGDFYQLYWDLDGGHFNLVVTQVVIAVRLPGREPAVKRFVLTGQEGALTDKNSVVKDDENNISGFANLYPLLPGESMYLFLTLPKIDFLPKTTAQKFAGFIDNFGDVVFCFIYVLITILSCLLSWRYITHQMAFRNVSLPSSMVVRALWRGASDIKSAGCALLDVYRKNLIEIEENGSDVILVRKTAHARHLTDFEKNIFSLFFSKKDSICRAISDKTAQRFRELVKVETDKRIRRLGLKLASMYMLSNAVLLLLVEVSLVLWNPNALLLKVFAVVDAILLMILGLSLLMKKTLWKKILLGFLLVVLTAVAALVSLVYLNWVAVVLLFVGIWVAILFGNKASGLDAMLKNAVKSAYQMREFLISQKETIASGRNFAVQQPNIFALELEDMYLDNPKIHDVYKLELIKKWLTKVF